MTDPEKKFDADTFIPIIGVLALVFVIIFLLSTPGMIIAKSISTIDTELTHASGDETPVRTLMDFGNAEHVDAFPRNIGDWRSMNFNVSRTAKSLGADAMILRQYANLSNDMLRDTTIVSFAIIQSNNVSSFHSPIVCYSAQGYNVEEEGTEEILISNATWAESPLYSTWDPEEAGCFNGSISVKKVVLNKESKDGKVTDREIILYFYVKGNPLAMDPIAIIRAAARAPLNGSEDDKIINSTKEFLGEAFPYMFEVQEKEEITAVQLAKGLPENNLSDFQSPSGFVSFLGTIE